MPDGVGPALVEASADRVTLTLPESEAEGLCKQGSGHNTSTATWVVGERMSQQQRNARPVGTAAHAKHRVATSGLQSHADSTTAPSLLPTYAPRSQWESLTASRLQ